ncbi:uncharacterized protein CELE_C48B4.3 [Caenorhabditis elegans]|uniref:Uncharacterized protein C48B4.3 n=1 Tax=Caenorhabditis elegans TaxID=6239 RepID=YLH3_CAEEL|nr:Uncharacterized protein CELE_C48B4.3 [Caenorhabditis elegans]P34357.1 RecName: Full=Uncharacterized protein C48B4.3 [Caenorhabditis elegans]CAA82374.1 Uncharacterized protein CELE_C48B4.3 [Caenorhabditis elegans]|eukprot:NP_499118.1 Uncharacterized protein CELE_C48B4.3 [Caenorhabditis elegans]
MDEVANALAVSQTMMEKMQKLEISKNYDVEKFETLLRLPARDVNTFMEKEAKKTDDEKMTDMDRRIKRIREDKTDRAARTLQKYFRKIRVKGEQNHINKRISKIPAKRRVVLLEQIRQKMGEQQPIRRFGGYQVIRAVELHKGKQKLQKDWLAKLSIDVNFHDKNLSRPNSPTHFIANSIPTLIRKKAEMKHAEKMQEIDSSIMDIYCGFQKDNLH